MPEVRFTIRWPDGKAEDCYSPSSVIKEHLEPGRTYPIADFRERVRTALSMASDRVRAKYGFPCSLALGQIERIEAVCRTYDDTAGATVGILSFQE
jgi:uncharacterized repeat protein (TIGR04042 family)